MLRLILLLALAPALLSVPAAAQAVPAWETLAASPFNSYRGEDVAFVGARGWAIYGSGDAWRTLDGGDTWTQTAELPGYLRAAGFASENVGWLGVLFGPEQLYETRDGGLSYADVTARIQPVIAGGICGIWVQDAQTVYAVGQFSTPAYLVRTSDGGATWRSQSLSNVADALIDVRFFDDQHGLASGGVGPLYFDGSPRIIGTDDGGATWTVRHTVAGVPGLVWKLSFPSRLVGYAAVERFDDESGDALVLKTVDGGRTWTEIVVPGGGSLQGVGFVTPELGWISGRGRTSVTTDGGLTWARVPPADEGGQLDGIVNRFRFSGDSLGYAAGSRIYRFRAPGTTAAEDGPDVADGLTVLAPNPSRGSVTVGYRTATAGDVRVDVFDVRGRRVASLVDGPAAPGEHVATWEPGAAAPGLYVVRMRSAAGVWSRAVSVVR